MATTEVILREKVEGLGTESEVVKVKRGFARNFLIPQNKAFEATRGNLRHIAHLKDVRAQREAEELSEAQKVAEKLRKLRLNTTLAIGQGGKAFGSITTADIATLINEKSKLSIDRHQVLLEKPIKTLGSFTVPIKIHVSHPATISLRVLAPDKEGEESQED